MMTCSNGSQLEYQVEGQTRPHLHRGSVLRSLKSTKLSQLLCALKCSRHAHDMCLMLFAYVLQPCCRVNSQSSILFVSGGVEALIHSCDGKIAPWLVNGIPYPKIYETQHYADREYSSRRENKIKIFNPMMSRNGYTWFLSDSPISFKIYQSARIKAMENWEMDELISGSSLFSHFWSKNCPNWKKCCIEKRANLSIEDNWPKYKTAKIIGFQWRSPNPGDVNNFLWSLRVMWKYALYQ